MCPAMYVHLATGYELCPIGLTCGIMLGNLQFRNTFIVYKTSQKELIIGLEWQKLITKL